MAMPTLPPRIDSVTGTLALMGHPQSPDYQPSRLVLRDMQGFYELNNGDAVASAEWQTTVKHAYDCHDALNGELGKLFKRAENKNSKIASVHPLPARYYFLARPPEEVGKMDKWFDALEHLTDITVHFCSPPFVAPSQKFIAGFLEPFSEQGMESGVMWSVYEGQKIGYDALQPLEINDKLIIYHQNGQGIYWQGEVTKKLLNALKSQTSTWFTRPKNSTELATELGPMLFKAFRGAYPAVLIKGAD